MKHIILGTTMACMLFAACGKKKKDPNNEPGVVLPGENATTEQVIAAVLAEINAPIVADAAMETLLTTKVRGTDTLFWQLKKFDGTIKGTKVNHDAYNWKNKFYESNSKDLDYRYFYEHDGFNPLDRGLAYFNPAYDSIDKPYSFYQEDTYGMKYTKDGMVGYWKSKGCTNNADSIRWYFLDKDDKYNQADKTKYESIKTEYLDKGKKVCISHQGKAITYIQKSNAGIYLLKEVNLSESNLSSETGDILAQSVYSYSFSLNGKIELTPLNTRPENTVSPYVQFDATMASALLNAGYKSKYWNVIGEKAIDHIDEILNDNGGFSYDTIFYYSTPSRKIEYTKTYSFKNPATSTETKSEYIYSKDFSTPDTYLPSPFDNDYEYTRTDTYTKDGNSYNYQRKELFVLTENSYFLTNDLLGCNIYTTEEESWAFCDAATKAEYKRILDKYKGKKVYRSEERKSFDFISIKTAGKSFDLTKQTSSYTAQLFEEDKKTLIASYTKSSIGDFSKEPVSFEPYKARKKNKRHGIIKRNVSF